MTYFYPNTVLWKAVWVFSALLLPVACNKSDPKEHLQRGVEYFKHGDYEKAKLELKTSSQSDKDTAQTYYYLALLDEKNHQYKAMRENLSKVIELEPKNTEARLKLGKLLLPFGESDAALAQAESILKESAQNLDALALKASVFIRQKKQEEALVIIENILQKNPKFIDALSLKALIYNERNEKDKALALLETAMVVEPKNIDLNFFKIQLHAKDKDMTAVMKDYEALTTLYPDNEDYKVTLARLYTQVGRYQDAETLLRNLMAKSPNDIKPQLLLLDFLSDTALDKVIDHLNQFVHQHNDEPRKLLELAHWTIARKRLEESEKILNRVVDIEQDSPVGLSAKTLMAKIAFDKQNISETEKLIGEILEDNANYNDAKVLQARVLLFKKQHDNALDVLNKVLLSQPELEEALLLSGQLFLAIGDQKKATQYFNNTLKTNPANAQALGYLYNKALNDHAIKAAKDMVLMAVKYQPNNIDFLEKLARVNLQAGDLPAAKDAVDKIADSPSALAPDVANFLRAQIFQAEGHCNQAIEIYQALLVKFPGNKDTLHNMAQCFDTLNKRSDMIAVLKNLRIKEANNVTMTLLLADLLLHDKKITEGVDILTTLLKNNAKVPQVYLSLAQFKLAQNDKKAAISVYQDGLKQNPENSELALALAAAYQAQGDNDQAVQMYEDLLKKNPHLDAASNSFAVLLIEQYGSADKLQKAVQLSEAFKDSDQPYYKDTYAWALIKQGKLNEGIALLQEVITSAPNVSVFRYHLGVAYANSDSNGSAMAELQQALDLATQQGDFPELQATKELLARIIAKTRGH